MGAHVSEMQKLTDSEPYADLRRSPVVPRGAERVVLNGRLEVMRVQRLEEARHDSLMADDFCGRGGVSRGGELGVLGESPAGEGQIT